jgi:thiamine-monophosphate kinase
MAAAQSPPPADRRDDVAPAPCPPVIAEIRGEREFVRRLAIELSHAPAPNSVPFGDDMAELGGDWLWTTDTLMDGVDFDARVHNWRQIGRKAMAVSLSDCAAMGTTPHRALLSLVLNDTLAMADGLDIVRGARDCGERFGCSLIGGDTNSWPHPTVITTTIAAIAEDGPPLLRSTACAGDRLFVSGPLGGSILGRQLTFEPRVSLGRALARGARPSAMMDISDGVVIDLARICEASHCGAILNAAELERAVHDDAHRLALQDGKAAREHALYDGEDFELLVAMPPNRVLAAEQLGFLPIGEITRGPGIRLRDELGRVSELEVRGWEHFR